LRLTADKQVILALQRLDALKRTDVILRSMPRVLAGRPRTHLVIAGQGPDLRRLQEICAGLGIGDSVTFAGFIPDEEKRVYFAMADLFAFHSTYETFGIVLAEAMSYGKPVVSVRNTAIPEIVKHGTEGLLVPTLDHEAFAEAVLRLLGNPSLRAEMGRRGCERVRSAFRWESIVPAYEAVFRAAAAGGKG
jgi:glycosyltransferase involved in cell wall biosynthesis